MPIKVLFDFGRQVTGSAGTRPRQPCSYFPALRRSPTWLPEARLGTRDHSVDLGSLRRVCVALARTYGNPRHGNKRGPLDELVFIILSTRTRDDSYRDTSGG